jgi:hypothetical protein
VYGERRSVNRYASRKSTSAVSSITACAVL